MENEEIVVPYHVAIIPDGNRRWARKRDLQPWDGHEEGAKNFEKLINHSLQYGVKVLSLWGSSMDNLIKRPMSEKVALLEIYRRYFERLLEGKEIYENEVRVNIIGRWEEQFPAPLKKLLYEAIDRTKHFQKRVLNFMLAYSGTDDMQLAIQKISDNYPEGTKITPEIIKENLMTANLPKVDFLVRTGGEPHNSTGFMMWDLSDSQYYFSPELFPDFTVEKYEEALADYARRQRRFGG